MIVRFKLIGGTRHAFSTVLVEMQWRGEWEPMPQPGYHLDLSGR